MFYRSSKKWGHWGKAEGRTGEKIPNAYFVTNIHEVLCLTFLPIYTWQFSQPVFSGGYYYHCINKDENEVQRE